MCKLFFGDMGGLIVGVLVLVIYSGCVTADFTLLDEEVQAECIKRCPLQNRTDDGHYDIGCGYDCNIEQCNQGCKNWAQALESSCQTVCNGTQEILPPKELYCVMGCNDAMTRYFAILRERIGTPPAPALVADSLTATSLRLEWDFGGSRYAGVRYLVQWRYEELSAAWQYCRNQTWGKQDTVFVDNLQPYTKYRFRVALLLSHHHGEPIVSEPSVVISTLASGTPASAPAIVRAVPVDWSRISVSWEPGPFPHGPILSYVLNISENHPHGYSALKDIPAAVHNFYMLHNLVPDRNYSVSVSMRNSVGAGPPATVYVSTPEEPAVKDTQKPILILGAHHTVIQQGADMLDEPSELYKTQEFIKGLAIHISRQLLFISDSKGFIHQTSLTNRSRSKILLTPQQLKFEPLDLSVDWLNDQLYILGEVAHNSRSKVFQITRFGLDGGGLTVAVAGLLTKPHHIEVDPYNGYLFWVMDTTSRPGLYRLDLADISNGIKHDIQPDMILGLPNLGAFTVDHTKFHLLVPYHNNNTVYSVSLDGREIVDLRSNTQQSQFHNVLSLATANGLFYWTNGDEVLTEEFHSGSGNYFHNTYPDLRGRSYMTVAVNLPSCQPIPIPVNPPTGVQAILGSNLAKTSWQMPHLLGGQGKGAWQNWSYEIHIKDITDSKITSHKNINATSYTIKELKENTEYIIKSAAYTSSGTGPWSTEFKGKTLKKPFNDKYPAIIWSAAEGLLKSDVTGENVETLIHKINMNDYYVTNIAWYEDLLYFVSNSSHMFWYNMTNHKRGKLNDIDSVGSVAIDWVGKKLYWSNPKQQLIIRGNLNGTQHEPLPILTVAKELYVDAVNAYIYWSTGHSVECARLNGVERQIYHPAQLFSGKQVMGLTLDNEQETVYWIVRSHEGSTLFKQQMAQHLPNGGNHISIKVSSLQKPNMQGPLCYFDDHLLWLQDDTNAVIGDMNGQNAAVISGISLSGLSMVSILDPSLHVWKNNSNVTVIPNAVLYSSVRVEGTWDSFNITWDPITNVNYGQLFYEIKIDDVSKKDMTRVTTNPYITYWKSAPPYTRLNIAIRAYTYWGSAPQVRGYLYTPSSTPSVPQNPRCYVVYNHHPFSYTKITIKYRWNPPKNSNGVINGYVVKFWYNNELKECKETVVKPENLKYALHNVTSDTEYHFQVQAFTDIGNGAYSEIISCNTSNETPVPQLLIASSDSIYIQDFDTDKSYIMVENINRPTEIAYMVPEFKLFWLNELNELFFACMTNINKTSGHLTKLLSMKESARGLTVDWLERSLYYIQNDIITKGSSIYKLNLNKIFEGKEKIEFILSSSNIILNLKVSPFTRHIYWIEVDQKNKNILKQASMDGKNVKSFFEKNLHAYKRMTNQEYLPCNCPNFEHIENIFTIEHTNFEPKIIFVDANTHQIVSADRHGCYCDSLLSGDIINKSLPLVGLATDVNKIYWSNSSTNSIYFVDKTDKTVKTERTNGNNFILYGTHVQPFPIDKCLIPQLVSPTVTFHSKTANSITLLLPEVKTEDDCDNISMASVKFTIYYKKFDDKGSLLCDHDCSQLITFDKRVRITGLKPFSKYLFAISIRNYFIDLRGGSENIGPGLIFQTAAGAPTQPQNVSAVVLNPTMVEVKWLPPQELNGDSVLYEIHWRTEGTINGVRQKGEQVVFRDKDSSNSLNKIPKYKITILSKLSPNQTYLLWVRAYSENNETYSDSDSISIHTYPEPNDIILLNSTAKSLVVNWKPTIDIRHYIIQFTNILSNKWKDVSNVSEDGVINVDIKNLSPKSKYTFRLNLKYLEYPEWFIWPKDARFTFETLGDRPSPPGVPVIQHVKGDVYQISWEAAKENGAPIIMYNLEGLGYHNYRSKRNTNRKAWFTTSPYVEEKEHKWISYYNGTETYWIISNLSDKLRYSFRVSALNENGWSNPSEESSEFDISAAAMLAEKSEQMSIILGISIPLLAMICVSILICFVYMMRRKDKEKKTTQTLLISQSVNPDVELATLRELPRRDNFIHNTNALYVSGLPSAEELALLPQINRDQITLINFLGRGAFGEVYEGKAKGIGENEAEIKVAVKTLRKGATEQEKIEFLQEAQLMSHFKHEHILQLLGVCLDTHFIIMELMQGGDLLTYLRSNRKPVITSNTLTILDLLTMCVDVAKGCRYLEEMHFVHRDLACRNCLVSSKDRESRVVKIGDFGLARDIYKNDYYRKEGEGLLPVRWMAPESLVDGVFTCQSDVWAFGVLMWEIMTLGQQPYPARNNLEVLHYVKGGGRLEKPTYCPEELHTLMMLCWSYQPENRPTFKYSLEVLEKLCNSTTDKSLTAAHSGNYVSSVQNVACGVSNCAYFQDDNHNDSGGSWKTEENSDKDHTPLVNSTKKLENTETPKKQSTEIPKYLEIICDTYLTNLSDGYEIPRSSIRKCAKKTIESNKNNRSRTFSNSSTLSNDSSVSTSKLNNEVNSVQKTIVQKS